jgi:hypothetical protein
MLQLIKLIVLDPGMQSMDLCRMRSTCLSQGQEQQRHDTPHEREVRWSADIFEKVTKEMPQDDPTFELDQQKDGATADSPSSAKSPSLPNEVRQREERIWGP